jgi:dTDP-L-rhamnose 4-epimerase
MSKGRALITGGAGFIGSHLADHLLERGWEVRALDALEPQVHGPAADVARGRVAAGGEPGWHPPHLDPRVELIVGDVTDRPTVHAAMKDVDVVFHEAALVGVGQSMYHIERYTRTNALGCAVLLDVIVNDYRDQIRKIVVASSMSIYGEGAYLDPETGAMVSPDRRPDDQMRAREWEVFVPGTRRPAVAIPTPETKPLRPNSIYAVNKRDHEEMVLSIGDAYKIPAVALRYFNVYGSRQALSNPYTGVAAIFSSCYLNGEPPLIFEDGAQSRDFVHVRDIARANVLALECDAANGEVMNIGSGRQVSIAEVARLLRSELFGAERIDDPALAPRILGQFREGDIRHCFADIAKAKRLIGYEPEFTLADGVGELVSWVQSQHKPPPGGPKKAHHELVIRELAN